MMVGKQGWALVIVTIPDYRVYVWHQNCSISKDKALEENMNVVANDGCLRSYNHYYHHY